TNAQQKVFAIAGLDNETSAIFASADLLNAAAVARCFSPATFSGEITSLIGRRCSALSNVLQDDLN
ncbi:MAG TPA: hypothetical protein VF700_12400, partial [Segetibacter sp.]